MTWSLWIVTMLAAAWVLALSHAAAKAAIPLVGVKWLLFFRAAAAMLASLPLVYLLELRGPLDLQAGWQILLAVALSPILINVFYFVGLRVGDLGVQNALRQNSPLFVVFLQTVFFATPMVPMAWAGVSMLLVGTVGLAVASRGSKAGPLAMIAGILAAAAHGGSIIAQAFATAHINPLGLVLVQNVLFFAFAAVLCARELPTVASRIRLDRNFKRGAILASLSGVGTNFIYDGLKLLAMPVIGPAAVSCMSLANLPISVWLGRRFFAERPAAWVYIWIATVLAGALVLAWVILPVVAGR